MFDEVFLFRPKDAKTDVSNYKNHCFVTRDLKNVNKDSKLVRGV